MLIALDYKYYMANVIRASHVCDKFQAKYKENYMSVL